MTQRSTRIAYASAGAALLVTALGALGLVADVPTLAGLRRAYIPMAPSTAFVLLLLGAGVLAYLSGAAWPAAVPAGRRRWAAGVPALVGAALTLTILVGHLGPVSYDIESLVLGTARTFLGDPASAVPVGRMSPLTAVLGLSAALALALLAVGDPSPRAGPRSPGLNSLSRTPSPVPVSSHLSSVLAGTCVTVSGAVLIGYAYETPLLYGGSVIPTALNTATALFALGVALLAAQPPGVLILRPFETSTFQGRLLRAFLPLTAVLVLAQGWVQTQIAANTTRNPALWAWVAALLSVGVVGFVVTVVARRMGQTLTRAKAALAESERNLRLIADNTTDVIFAYTMDRRLLFANAAAGSLNPVEDVLGASFIDRLHSDDRGRVETLLARAFFGAPFTTEFRVVAPEGEVKWFRSSVGPLFDEAGRQIGIQGREHDITEVKEAEAALRLQEEALLQSQKMEAIGQLAGGIAHDFNNLLTAMGGYGDIVLADGRLDPALRPELEEIRKGVERAASLTRQILTFSRKQVSSPRVLDLNECLENMHGLLHRTLAGR
ncbi:MAG: PAS domain S-box protein [Thermoleophilia bacterium]|nr:PAS domain S-box protein [Thermoleophilia bacterium]